MVDGEEKILTLAIRGKASAFGSLYDHYQPRIYRFVAIKVGRREEAEDLTHQVFLNAWQSISGYKHLGHPFSSWLYKIARNSIIDNARTKKETIPLYDLDMEPHIEPAIEKTLDLNKEFNSAMKAIGQLN